jgi:WD40 repeat protein/serine/threonine protein kinase
MPANACCPTRADLERLLLGTVPAPEAEQLERHLAGCPRCLAVVRDLHVADPLTEAVQKAPTELAIAFEEALVPYLIERMSALRKAQPETLPAAGEDFPTFSCEADGTPCLGPYHIRRVLGSGGMGVVYLAEDTLLKRQVALKVLRPSLAANPSARARFLREARAAAALEHDHIVTIHQVGEADGVPFLVMPLLRGETLEDRLKREKSLAPAEAQRIGREVAAALVAAHEHGLIHRDVKPGNIWLEAGSGRVKLLDFGLARAATEETHLTQTGLIVGTPAYMAPEQARGEALDGRSDLFSLGCVLYRALTGQPAFAGSNSLAILTALATHDPPPVRKLAPAVPPALGDLVMKLLAKEPANRCPSAQAVLDALREEGVRPPERPRGSRRRTFAVAACLLGLLGVGLLYAPTMIRIVTNTGELVIEADDRDIEVTVQRAGTQPEVLILDRRTQRELVLTAGEYDVRVQEKDGLQFSTKQFTLRRGGREVVKAELVPAKEPPSATPAVVVASPTTPIERTIGDGRWCHWNWVCAVAVSPDGKWVASASGDGTAKVWDAATGQERYTLVGHTNSVECVAFAPNGKLLATGGLDSAARLWDLKTGQSLRALHLNGPVHTVAFRSDGKTVGTMTKSLLQLWEVDTGKEVLTIGLGPEKFERITGGFAFSPDGRALAYRAGTDGVKICDAGTGNEKQVLPGRGRTITCVAWSPDGKILASGSLHPDAEVVLWSADTGKPLGAFTHPQADEGIMTLTFTPDSRRLAALYAQHDLTTYKFYGRLRQWDLATGREGPVVLPKTYHGFYCATFNHDGSSLITGSVDLTIRHWDPATGQERGAPGGATGFLNALAVSPAGKTLAVGSYDHTITLFDPATGQKRRTLRGHQGAVGFLAFSPDGNLLASSALDGTVRLWDLVTGTEQHILHAVAADCIAFRPDGQVLGTIAWGTETARLWDVKTGAEWHKLDQMGLNASPVLAFSPDNRTLATGRAGLPVDLWDLATGKRKQQLLGSIQARALAYSPDGKMLAVANEGNPNQIRLWDTATGQMVRPLADYTGVVNITLAFRTDGRMLAAGGFLDGTVRLWDPATGQLLWAHRIGPAFGGRIHVVAFAEGNRLAVLNGNGTVSILRPPPLPATPGAAAPPPPAGLAEAASSKPSPAAPTSVPAEPAPIERTLGDPRLRHWSWVHDVAVSPDGKLLASAGRDGVAKVWDMGTGAERWALVGHAGPVLCVAYQAQGKYLVTGGMDTVAKLWNAQTGAFVRNLFPMAGLVHTVAFSPDGKVLAAMTPWAIRLYDVETGEERLVLLEPDGGIDDIGCGLGFSPDGQTLAYRSRKHGVRLCDATTGKERRTFQVRGKAVSCVAWSPDGKTLAVGTTRPDPVVAFLDAETGAEQRVYADKGPEVDVLAVTFRQDGKALAAAGMRSRPELAENAGKTACRTSR